MRLEFERGIIVGESVCGLLLDFEIVAVGTKVDTADSGCLEVIEVVTGVDCGSVDDGNLVVDVSWLVKLI